MIQFDESEWVTARFFVCETTGPPILSCSMSEKLGIISVSQSKLISVVKCADADVAKSDVTKCSDDVKGVKLSGDCETVIRDRDKLREVYPDRFKGLGTSQRNFTLN